MTEAIILTLCNNHSSIFRPRRISDRAPVRTVYSQASLSFPPWDSGSGWSTWFPSLAMSLPPSHVVHHPHMSSGLPFQEHPQLLETGRSQRWWHGGCWVSIQLKFEPTQLWHLQAPTQRCTPREGEELRQSSYRGEGIHLDGGLGLWRAGNVKLESGDSQQHNQKLP